MGVILWAFLGFIVLVAFGLTIRRIVDWMGSPCQFCEAKTQPFRRVPPDLQALILQYFSEHERRLPDKAGLFVCMACRTVHDDFSGEKQSRDIDRYGCVTFCKVCHAVMRGCEPDRGTFQCPSCDTAYEWRRHAPSGFRFLMPPAGAELTRPPPYLIIDSK